MIPLVLWCLGYIELSHTHTLGQSIWETVFFLPVYYSLIPTKQREVKEKLLELLSTGESRTLSIPNDKRVMNPPQ